MQLATSARLQERQSEIDTYVHISNNLIYILYVHLVLRVTMGYSISARYKSLRPYLL